MASRDYPVKDGAGNVIIAGTNGGLYDGSDTGLVETDVATSATPGTWVELMPANNKRQGASVQAAYAAGNTFIKQLDTGFPSSGKQVGELQIPVAPAYFKFDFTPDKRFVVRGDTASIILSLKTW